MGRRRVKAVVGRPKGAVRKTESRHAGQWKPGRL